VQGERLSASVVLSGTPRDCYVQLPYRLSELEFWILTKTRNKLDTFAFAFLTGAAIALINATTKLWLHDPDVGISPAELFAPLAIAIVGVLIYAIGRLLPNDQRRLVAKIENHFKQNPSIGASMDTGDGDH
jgi:hypothetical protein